MKVTLISKNRFSQNNGSAILVALMLMAVSTIGIAAWVTIVNSRNAYTVSSEDAMRRRVALDNSRQIAEEYLYRVAATHSRWEVDEFGAFVGPNQDGAATPYNPGAANDPNPAADPAKPEIVERVQIDSWIEAPLQTSFADGRANRFSPSDGESFSKVFRVRLGTGSNLIERDFFLRSRSPIFSGDLVTFLRPNITPGNYRFGGNVKVDGRTVIWRPDMIGGTPGNQRFASESYEVKSSSYGSEEIKNSGGSVIRPSNFPATPVSTGFSSGGNGFDGRSSLVVNEVNDVNSLHIRYPNNDVFVDGSVDSDQLGVQTTAGEVTIDLSNALLKKVYIKNNVTKVSLIGQTTDSDFASANGLAALVIVIEQDDSSLVDLDDIELYGRNNRRLIVGVKKTIAVGGDPDWLQAEFRFMDSRGPGATPPTAYPTWRLVVLCENAELSLRHRRANSEVTIYGGLMTDRGMWSHNNNNRRFFIKRDPDPLALVGLTPRNVWLESYSLPE